MRFQEQLSSWSPRRVIVACLLWIIGAPVAAAIGLLLLGLILAALSGPQSIAFEIKLTNWTTGLLLVPPILLVGAWIWSRRASD